ncbi:MAG: membrane protein insertion efficiency factor YidD [Planctomycetota bacterium]
MKPLLLGLIRFYQKFLSPMLGANCRFEPTCSHYTAQAIEIHGSMKGSLLGIWRILRCNPLSRGGQIDPVPPKGRWRAPDDQVR